MRFNRSSILTLLLVAWTAVESGTVALLHEHLHACGAHRHDSGAEFGSAPLCGDRAASACGHAHHGLAATSAAALGEVRTGVAPKSFRSVRLGVRQLSTAEAHPDDCTLCRHLRTARSLAMDPGPAASFGGRPLFDFELPEAPCLVRREILRTRGPPCRTLMS